jgi:hypothetical protein
VTGSSDKRTKEVSFNFTKKNTNTTLPDSKQIDEWQNKFIKEKGALITGKQEEHKKLGQKMPFYCSIAQYQGMSGDDIYYDQPTIVSEYFDPITGMGTIVVKTQIDHSAGAHKMQRARDCLIWTKEQKRSSA